MQLVDARLQALVLVDQGIADQHARHAAVLLRKTEQHRDDRLELAQSAFFLGRDLVHQRKQRLLDELDEPLEHLGLALEVAVERRLRHAQPRRQRRRGDLLARGTLQHLRQRLQDLVLALARFRCHVRFRAGSRKAIVNTSVCGATA